MHTRKWRQADTNEDGLEGDVIQHLDLLSLTSPDGLATTECDQSIT
jgi:hypothetical protein